MCEPVSITMGVMAAAGALQYNEQAKKTAKNHNKAVDANYKQGLVQSSKQGQEELEQKQQASLENKQATLQNRATAQTRASSVGASGSSIDSMFSDIIQQGNTQEATLNRNLLLGNQARHDQNKASFLAAKAGGMQANLQSPLIAGGSAGLKSYVSTDKGRDNFNNLFK